MATRKPRRSEWKKTKQGGWTCSLGNRGMRIRLFQKRENGGFFRETWIPGDGKSIAQLGTTDRDEAKRLGTRLLGELMLGNASVVAGPVRLGDLWTRFSRDCPQYLDNKPATRRDAASRANVLLGYFGEKCDVRQLSADDQRAYFKARAAGGVRCADGRITRPARTRSAEADIVLLRAMLAWATTVRTTAGGYWLERDPLRGVRRQREANPRRPVATLERFTKTRDSLRALADCAESDSERARWWKVELALVLAEATGRRLGSIRQLRWEDIGFESGTIRWRPEFDKKGREWLIPSPPELLSELREFRTRLGVIAGWLFPGERQPEQPMDRHLFDKWLSFAERSAGLPKLEGGLWHPYRRKWATERKGHAIKDVASAGGWKDTDTLLQCYQQADNETLLAVMSEPRKYQEGAVSAVAR